MKNKTSFKRKKKISRINTLSKVNTKRWETLRKRASTAHDHNYFASSTKDQRKTRHQGWKGRRIVDLEILAEG